MNPALTPPMGRFHPAPNPAPARGGEWADAVEMALKGNPQR